MEWPTYFILVNYNFQFNWKQKWTLCITLLASLEMCRSHWYLCLWNSILHYLGLDFSNKYFENRDKKSILHYLFKLTGEHDVDCSVQKQEVVRLSRSFIRLTFSKVIVDPLSCEIENSDTCQLAMIGNRKNIAQRKK